MDRIVSISLSEVYTVHIYCSFVTFEYYSIVHHVNLVLFNYNCFCITVSYDVCYHLLKLFTDPKHQLEALLNPATITADPLDISVRSEALEFVSLLKY